MLKSGRWVLLLGIGVALSACGGGGGGAAPPAPPPCAVADRTCYVSVTGDDTNSGADPQNALRHISKAAQIALSGYTIVVAGGTYREGVTTAPVGRAPQGLMFIANGTVTLDGTGTADTAGFNLFSSLGSVIDGFRITGFRDAGIVIKSGSDNFIIRNCTVFGNLGTSTDGIRVQDSANVVLFNNLIYNNSGNGIAIVGQSTGSPTATVINNTIVGNQFRGITVGTTTTASDGAFLRNNIVQGNGGDFSIKVFTPPPASVPRSDVNYSADFNIVFPATYSPANIQPNHDIAKDALFVNAAGGDYHLRSDSPAINAGDSLNNATDLRTALRNLTTTGGTNCDKSALDIGFHYPPDGRCTAVGS